MISYNSVLKRGSRIALRNKVNDSLYTGIRLIDLCLPIGNGVRMLILGDKATGKTSIFLSTVLTSIRLNTYSCYGNKRLFGIYIGINVNLSKLSKLLSSLMLASDNFSMTGLYLVTRSAFLSFDSRYYFSSRMISLKCVSMDVVLSQLYAKQPKCKMLSQLKKELLSYNLSLNFLYAKFLEASFRGNSG